MEPKFIVDANAGRLAKWLRIMGYDTVFIKEIADEELVRIALRENRIILTRDTRIAQRRAVNHGQVQVVLIQHDRLEEQLQQVVQELGLRSRRGAFSLCIECNQELAPLAKDKVRGLVPAYVFHTQETFYQCPSCRRTYWQGTHWQRMKEELGRLPKGEVL